MSSQTTLSTEAWIYQVKPFLQPLHLLSWISSMRFTFFSNPQRQRERQRDGGWRGLEKKGRQIKKRTHILLKVRFVSLLFCYHDHCYNLCYGLFGLQFIFQVHLKSFQSKVNMIVTVVSNTIKCFFLFCQTTITHTLSHTHGEKKETVFHSLIHPVIQSPPPHTHTHTASRAKAPARRHEVMNRNEL